MLKEIILEKRKQKNMTQEQLAEQLGVARQTVSKWELGETLPDVENLRKMAILFEFSIDEALGLEVKKDDETHDDKGHAHNEEEDDDKDEEWLMMGGFIIGSALGLFFDNTILMFVCCMVGYGLSFIMKAFRKRDSFQTNFIRFVNLYIPRFHYMKSFEKT